MFNNKNILWAFLILGLGISTAQADFWYGVDGQGEFAVIDVRKLQVVEHYYLGNQVDIWDVTCHNAL
jgi:hypothetical protein